MKKILLVILMIFALVMLIGLGIASLFTINKSNSNIEPVTKTNPTNDQIIETTLPTPWIDTMTSYKDIMVEIDGKQIALKNGLAEEEGTPGSNIKIITRYFGNEAFGDLNGDGKEDIAYLITQEGGGSGTFFYIVVALQTRTGYVGSNAVYLGDRIAPQTTAIQDGEIQVNFADRKIDEPFTAQPTIGISKYFKMQESKLIESLHFFHISNHKWIWVSTIMNDGTSITPENPDSFSINFNEDGSFTGTTDCNSFFGKLTIENNKMVFGPIGSTKMFCEDSQEIDFLKALAEVESFLIKPQANQLTFLLKYDSGYMTFK